MRKAIVFISHNILHAITEDGDILMKKIEDGYNKNECIDYYSFFENNQDTILDNIENYEFEISEEMSDSYKKNSIFKTNLDESLSNINSKKDDWANNFNDFFSLRGTILGFGMGIYNIAIGIYYIKVKKKVIERKLNIFDEDKVWKFTFSTYKDDLISLNYNEALKSFYRKKSMMKLNNNYSNEDLIKKTDFLISENPNLISKRNKAERNILDVKNKRSMYIRIDKDNITNDDIENVIKRFEKDKYNIF